MQATAVCLLAVLTGAHEQVWRPGVHVPPGARGGHAARMKPAPMLATTAAAQWLSVPFDHTGETSKEQFNVRYYVDATYFVRRKPLSFFNMGGEGPTTGIGRDYVYDLAKRYGALIVSIEHRFYGQSFPYGNLLQAYATETLAYLTVEQALADAALLIDTIDSKYNGTKARTFTFGGSYSGALSAWFRMAYPTHTLGSLSSSGVVNALLEFPQFDQQVFDSLQDITGCAARLKFATEAFVHAIEDNTTDPDPRALFKVRSDLPAADFYYMIADAAAMSVQYGYKTYLCEQLKSHWSDGAMQSYATSVLDIWGQDFGSQCFYDTDCLVNGPNSKWVGGTDRCWRWQKCTQLAYLQTAPKVNSLRASALTLATLKQQCTDVFGLLPDTTPINNKFGADTPNLAGATNIFFSDFSDDPWQQASVRKNLTSSLPYELAECDDCGHCDDLGPPKSSDPLPLQNSRTRFETYLKKWLA